MNSKPDALKYFLPIAMVACFSILLLSWGGQKQTHQQKKEQSINDTVPKNKADKKIRDLDDVLDDLDRAEINVDMDMVNEQLKEAMKQIDMAKIKMDVDKAMKEVDMEKVNEQMKEAMKQVDMAKIKMDIDKAMKDVDMEKINEQMKEAMKQIDMTKLDADLKKLEIEMKGLGPKIEKEMENAKASIEKAKVEMKKRTRKMPSSGCCRPLVSRVQLSPALAGRLSGVSDSGSNQSAAEKLTNASAEAKNAGVENPCLLRMPPIAGPKINPRP